MVSNPYHFSRLGTTVTAQLTDGTDAPHTGLIKALAVYSTGSYPVKTSTDFNITAASATTINITSGKVVRDGELQAAITAGSGLTIGSTTAGETYSLVVVTSSNAFAVRTTSTSNLVPELSIGDIPIAVVLYTGVQATMEFQYFTNRKEANTLSVAYANSNVYTEILEMKGNAGNVELTGSALTDISSLDSANDRLLVRDATNNQLKLVAPQDVGGGDPAAIVDNSGTPAFASGITKAEVLALLNVADGAKANLVDDTTPQLGGNLDANGNNILIDNGNFIGDENGLEQIKFATTASAVNELTITNAATGNGPILEATGDDTNIDLNINTKGTTSSVKINSGMILDNGHITVGNQDSNIALTTTTGTTVGRHLDISAGSTAKGSNNLNGGNLNLKSGGGDGTGTSVITFHTKVSGTDDTDERMRIDTLGNLLIGSTGTSSTKLGVNGAVGAQAYHGAITEFTGNGLAGQNQLNLDASSMRTILTRSPVSAPNPPNTVQIQCPVSTTIEGWECRIICRENAGGADDTFIFTQGSDEIQDITGAVIADSSGTTYSLTAGKAYQLICIGNNAFVLYQIN